MFRKLFGKPTSNEVTSFALDLNPKANTGQRENRDPLAAARHVDRGIEIMRLQQYDQAIKEFSEAISLDLYCADAYANRAWVFTIKGLVRRALQDVNIAIVIEPAGPYLRMARAPLCLHTGEWSQMIEDCKIASTRNDLTTEQRSLVLGLMIWAKAQMNDTTWTTHVDDYQVLMLERAKRDPSIKTMPPLGLIMRDIGVDGLAMSLAYAAVKQGKIQEAIDNFTKAVEVNRNNTIALLHRGIANLKQRNPSNSLRDFSSAIIIDDGYFAEPYFYRGIAYRIVGDHTKSRADFDQFVARGGAPANVEEQYIREKMGNLRI